MLRKYYLSKIKSFTTFMFILVYQKNHTRAVGMKILLNRICFGDDFVEAAESKKSFYLNMSRNTLVQTLVHNA